MSSSFYSGTGLTNNDQNAIDGAKSAAEAARDAAQAAQTAAEAASSSVTANAATTASDAATSTAARTAAEAARDLAEQYRDTAETHKNDAASSASNAATSEGAAETAQTNAAAARDTAVTAQQQAESARDTANTARDSAVSSLETMRETFLGASANAPTVDGNGVALGASQAGAVYFNTSNTTAYIWDGTQFNQATQSLSSVANATDNGFMSSADKVKLDAIDASADVTDATTVEAAGALMDSELTNEAAVKALDQSLATTDAPTFNELNLTTYADLTPITHPAHTEGRVFYDSTHKTLNYYSDITDVAHEIGTEEHIRVYNNSGATIAKGKPVHFSGNHSANNVDVPTIALADATSTTSYKSEGLTAGEIANGSYGWLIVSGMITGIDTSSLTAIGQFFTGITPGAIQTMPPVYPNYPMCIGFCTKIHATDGVAIIAQQNHSIKSFRVQMDQHIGGDLTIDGNLNVTGTTTTTSTSDVTAGAPMYRINEGNAIGEAGTDASGVTGLDDAFFAGHFTGTSPTTYYVKIDSVGTPDTFAVSTDNFATTISTGNAITGSEQMIHSADNISVTFGATTGHTLNDVWKGTARRTDVDTGFWTNRNTGTTGVGYTHMGLWFDSDQQKWNLVDEYDPVPAGVININDASYSTATLVANLEGNVTGGITAPVGNTSSFDTLTVNSFSNTSGTFNGSTVGDHFGIVRLNNSNSRLIYEGATDDANETSVWAEDPTQDNNIYVPNTSGVLETKGRSIAMSIILG